MHNSSPKHTPPRRTMDGFLSGPRRAQPQARHGLSVDRFHNSSGGRHVSDFKRPDGFHAAPQQIIASGGRQPNQPPQANAPRRPGDQGALPSSLLHMTLPGGIAEKEHRKSHAPKQSKWRTFRKWGLRSAAVVGAILIVGGGFMGYQAYSKLHKVFKGGGKAAALQAEVKPELLKGEGDGRVNIMLLGRGGDNHEGADLTDTILVASIDPLNKGVTMVSIPRDLWVTPSGGSSSKINAIYANAKYRALNRNAADKAGAEAAGMTAIEQQVTGVLGIPIHYYAMVDFDAFKEAVDTVGGVTVNVPSDLVDYTMAWENRGNPVLAKAGEQTFDGYHALMYVRSRHGSARGDFDRTERQRLFLQALGHKVLSAGTYTNPVKITQLMTTFGNHVSTDFSVNDMLRLGSLLKGADLSKMNSIGLADPPHSLVRTGSAGNQSIVQPNAGLGDYSQIQAYIRNALVDPYIAKEAAAIDILNGTTTPGLAGQKSDELKSYGYNVVKIGDAPTQAYTKTVLVDLTAGKKPYTRNYLQKRLGVTAVTKLPDTTIQATGADFVIILGQDE